jgi:ATP-binding cassette subfamily F protein 3
MARQSTTKEITLNTLLERELRREQQQREFENQKAFINKTQAFIRKNLEGQKTRQAKSRRNMLERLERLDSGGCRKSGRIIRFETGRTHWE